MYFLEAGDVFESYWSAEKGEDGAAPGGAEGPVFVVGGSAIPGAEAGTGGTGEGAGGVVRVH